MSIVRSGPTKRSACIGLAAPRTALYPLRSGYDPDLPMPIPPSSLLHRIAAPLVTALVVAGCAQSGRVQPDGTRLPTDSVVTFAEHVAPVLFRSCAPCHRPDGSAPFSVLSYDDVKPRAAKIAAAVESRRMPPWLPEPGYVEYAGERRLSQHEISLIRRWGSEE